MSQTSATTPSVQDSSESAEGYGQQNQRFNNNRRDRFRNRRERNRDRFRDENNSNGEDGNHEPYMPRPHPSVPEGFPIYSLSDLKKMPAHKLLEIAEQLNIHEGVARARKQDVIFALLKVLTRHGEGVFADGVLEILPDGFGFLRAAEASYLAGPDDTYISPVKFAASIYALVITCRAGFVSLRTVNGTLHCQSLIRLMANLWKLPKIRSFLRT